MVQSGTTLMDCAHRIHINLICPKSSWYMDDSRRIVSFCVCPSSFPPFSFLHENRLILNVTTQAIVQRLLLFLKLLSFLKLTVQVKTQRGFQILNPPPRDLLDWPPGHQGSCGMKRTLEQTPSFLWRGGVR